MKNIKELFNRRVIMAPMAGINLPSFCRVLAERGCDFIYTGLVTSHGLLKPCPKTLALVQPMPDGPDIIAQIFGGVPEIMAEAALRLEAMGRFAAIDINMGCPAPKVARHSGAGLMKDPALAGRIVKAVAESIRLPVTVKIRAGWDSKSINYLELAGICIDNGASAVALHPRTRAQAFTGTSDWALIRKLKSAVSVPVIGSGDIASPEDALRMMDETGCDSVMIGRAAAGNPWLLTGARHLIETGEAPPQPTVVERVDTALRHLDLHVEYEGEKRGVTEMRKFMPWYLKGIPGASEARRGMNTAATYEEARTVLLEFRQAVSGE